MLSKSLKILIVCLFLLAACVPVPPIQTPLPTASLTPTNNLPIPSTIPTQTLTPIPTKQNTPLPSATSTSFLVSTDQPVAGSSVSYLKMFDSNVGWAILSPAFINPENIRILRTTNGIHSWKDITPPINDNSSTVRTAYFIDTDTAVAASTQSKLPQSNTTDIYFWRTDDGGQTWQLGETITVEIPDFSPYQLFFLNEHQGWMLGISDAGMRNLRVQFFETQNGGKNWKKGYDTAEHISDSYTMWIHGYYPYSEHFIFVTDKAGFFSNGRLSTSQDGGVSWTFRQLAAPNDLPDFECQTDNCKYLDSVSVPMFTSPMDGVLLRRVYLNSEAAIDAFTYYPNPTNRMPFALKQYLYYTHDGGQTWIPRSSPVQIGTFFFKDANTGWLLGKNDPNPQFPTALYQTTDGGETWIQLMADCPLPLGSELLFVDQQTGFAFLPLNISDFYTDFDVHVKANNQKPSLFTTHDGGKSWETVESPTSP